LPETAEWENAPNGEKMHLPLEKLPEVRPVRSVQGPPPKPPEAPASFLPVQETARAGRIEYLLA